RFAGPNPDHIGLRLRDRDITDGRHRLVVKHRLPGKPAIYRLPHSARRCTRVYDVRVALDHGVIVGTPTGSGRSDLAEVERLERMRVLSLNRDRKEKGEQVASHMFV